MSDRRIPTSRKHSTSRKESGSTSRPSGKPKVAEDSQTGNGSRMPQLDFSSKPKVTELSRSNGESRTPRQDSSSMLRSMEKSHVDHSRTTHGESSRTQTVEPSRIPTYDSSLRVASRCISSYDQQMASRQTRIDTLFGRDRQEQDTWALAQLKQGAGSCWHGYGWERDSICWTTGKIEGYRCTGRGDFVSDDSIAAGLSECYKRVCYFDYNVDNQESGFASDYWYGPFTMEVFCRDMGISVQSYRAQCRLPIGIPTKRDDYLIFSSSWRPGPYPKLSGGSLN